MSVTTIQNPLLKNSALQEYLNGAGAMARQIEADIGKTSFAMSAAESVCTQLTTKDWTPGIVENLKNALGDQKSFLNQRLPQERRTLIRTAIESAEKHFANRVKE